MPRHPAHQPVMIGHVRQPVEVAAEPLLEYAKRQDAPKVHARPAGILARPMAFT